MSGPVVDVGTVTPNDSTTIEVTRAIYVGTAGNLAVRIGSGASVVFKSVGAGTILPIRADRVLATGTTAGDILALY
jgi:hypothetical protein